MYCFRRTARPFDSVRREITVGICFSSSAFRKCRRRNKRRALFLDEKFNGTELLYVKRDNNACARRLFLVRS